MVLSVVATLFTRLPPTHVYKGKAGMARDTEDAWDEEELRPSNDKQFKKFEGRASLGGKAQGKDAWGNSCFCKKSEQNLYTFVFFTCKYSSVELHYGAHRWRQLLHEFQTHILVRSQQLSLLYKQSTFSMRFYLFSCYFTFCFCYFPLLISSLTWSCAR